LTAKHSAGSIKKPDIPNRHNSLNGIQEIQNFWKNSDEKNAKFVWEEISKYKQFDFIWELVAHDDYKLAGDVIFLALDSNNDDFFKINDALRKTQNVIKNYDTDYDTDKRFVEKIVKLTNIEKEIIDDMDLIITNYDYVLDLIIKISDNSSLIDHIESKLKKITKEEWITSFEEDTSLTSLAINLQGKKQDFRLLNPLCDSLSEFIISWMSEENDPKEWFQNNLSELFNLLGSSFQIYLMKNLTEHVIEKELSLNPETFEYIKNYLDYQLIVKKGKQTLQNKIDKSIRDENLDDLIMIDSILSHKDCKKFTPDQYILRVIQEPFIQLFTKQTEEVKINLLKSLAEKLNLQTEIPESEKDESDEVPDQEETAVTEE